MRNCCQQTCDPCTGVLHCAHHVCFPVIIASLLMKHDNYGPRFSSLFFFFYCFVFICLSDVLSNGNARKRDGKTTIAKKKKKMPVHQYEGWSYERLRAQRNRAHFLLEDPYRYVTVLLISRPGKPDELRCIDSPCYHANGPLGEGDIVEIEDILCIRCPTHRYLVSIENGDEILLEVDPHSTQGEAIVGRHGAMPCYPMTSADPSAGGVTVVHGRKVQRIHRAWLDEASGVLSIEVEDQAVMRQHPLLSDRGAESVKNGGMCMQVFDIKMRGWDKL